MLSALIQYSTGRVLVHGVGHRPWAPPPWVLPGCSLGANGQAEAELVVLVRVRVRVRDRGWLTWVGLGLGLLGCRVRFRLQGEVLAERVVLLLVVELAGEEEVDLGRVRVRVRLSGSLLTIDY